MISEQNKIRIIVIMNHLKSRINPAYDNKWYREWKKKKPLMKFRDYVIEATKKEILDVLDEKVA